MHVSEYGCLTLIHYYNEKSSRSPLSPLTLYEHVSGVLFPSDIKTQLRVGQCKEHVSFSYDIS
jgi:hypothetical protein